MFSTAVGEASRLRVAYAPFFSHEISACVNITVNSSKMAQKKPPTGSRILSEIYEMQFR